jgi:hypothetical protein
MNNGSRWLDIISKGQEPIMNKLSDYFNKKKNIAYLRLHEDINNEVIIVIKMMPEANK